ncbi:MULTISPECIES: hypothetical protein [unclassified Pseudomonas]|jgi:hypothetical protein|uniref:hypothetical protein n=1 Tax=Pseudomonas TaxID=286 RepID=UPI00101FAC84|nr:MULTISPECIES: hypothetical protein [unclassified Pseudomonas]MCH4901275.1 hypothetical protein [Pseudomonas sp. B707]
MKYVTFDAAGILDSRLIRGVNDIPEGALEIDESLWMRITQELDGIWKLDDAGVISKHALPERQPAEYTSEEIESLRLRAYADPITGSDRFFAEAQRMEAMGETGWEAIRAAGVLRFNEIQQEFPWGTSSAQVTQ